VDLDETWQRCGEWEKNDPVRFSARSLQGLKRKWQKITGR